MARKDKKEKLWLYVDDDRDPPKIPGIKWHVVRTFHHALAKLDPGQTLDIITGARLIMSREVLKEAAARLKIPVSQFKVHKYHGVSLDYHLGRRSAYKLQPETGPGLDIEATGLSIMLWLTSRISRALTVPLRMHLHSGIEGELREAVQQVVSTYNKHSMLLHLQAIRDGAKLSKKVRDRILKQAEAAARFKLQEKS